MCTRRCRCSTVSGLPACTRLCRTPSPWCVRVDVVGHEWLWRLLAAESSAHTRRHALLEHRPPRTPKPFFIFRPSLHTPSSPHHTLTHSLTRTHLRASEQIAETPSHVPAQAVVHSLLNHHMALATLLFTRSLTHSPTPSLNLTHTAPLRVPYVAAKVVPWPHSCHGLFKFI